MFFSMLHSSVKRSVRCADIRRTPEVDSRMHPIQERKFSIHTAHDVRWQIIENKTQSSLEINVSIIIGSRGTFFFYARDRCQFSGFTYLYCTRVCITVP